MDIMQRNFLVQCKKIAKDKHRTDDITVLINHRISINQINGMTISTKIRIFEELLAQGLVISIKNRGENIKFYLTGDGLKGLNDSLISAGKSVAIVDIQINDKFFQCMDEIIKAINNSNEVNKNMLIEMMDVVREESNKEKPRKNIIALLLGTVANGTSLAANISTILSTAGIQAQDLHRFISKLL